MRICVADASVIAKWLLSDEEGRREALDLKKDLSEGITSIAVPRLMEYELASLLATAVRRGRTSVSDAAEGLHCVSNMGLVTCDEREVTFGAFMLAVETTGSVYDCAYLSAAMSLGCDLYTADRRFIALAKNLYRRLRHISEYSSS